MPNGGNDFTVPRWLLWMGEALKQGIAFQIVAIGLMVVIIAAYFGKIENPQMTALIEAVNSFNHQHSEQEGAHDRISRGLAKTEIYLDRNQIDIKRVTQVSEEGFKQVVRGLDKLCWVNAETKEKAREICGKD